MSRRIMALASILVLGACSDDAGLPIDASPDAAVVTDGASDLPASDVAPDLPPVQPDLPPIQPDLPPVQPDLPPIQPDLPPLVDGFVIPDGLTDGGKQKICTTLNAMYVGGILSQAKQCAPMLPVIQCTQQVKDQLACPCMTWVNPSNAKAIAQLAQLEASWKALGCFAACPAIPCPPLGPSSCTGGITGGQCQP